MSQQAIADRADAEAPADDGESRRVPRFGGPLYPRIFRLRHINPSAWQRALLVEGVASVGAILALADVITAWAPLILPVAVGGVVKFHDVLVGVLSPGGRRRRAVAPRAAPSAATVGEPASPDLARAAATLAPAVAAPAGTDAPELGGDTTVRIVPPPRTPGDAPLRPAAAPAGRAEPAADTADTADSADTADTADTAASADTADLAGLADEGFRIVPAPGRRDAAADASVGAPATTEDEPPAAVTAGDATAPVDEPIVAPEIAREDVDLLAAEAVAVAAELLRLDGEVELFALGVDHDGEIVPVDTVGAYDRVPLEQRVAALRDEVVRAAGAGEIRAAALAVARGDRLVVDVEHAVLEPAAFEARLTGTRIGPLRAGVAAGGFVATWGDPA